MMAANFFEDLEITLNGKPCGDACSVSQWGGNQGIQINVHKVLGSACRRQDTMVRPQPKPQAEPQL